MEHFWYLFAAYTVIMVVIFGYVLFMFYQQRRLRGEIDSLKEALKEKGED